MDAQPQLKPDDFLKYKMAEDLATKRRADPMVAGLRKVCSRCKRPFRASVYTSLPVCSVCK